MTITVTALVEGKHLSVGTYRDPAVADAVAQSWARWSGCRAAVIRPAGSPPIVVVRPSRLAIVPTGSPEVDPPAA